MGDAYTVLRACSISSLSDKELSIKNKENIFYRDDKDKKKEVKKGDN